MAQARRFRVEVEEVERHDADVVSYVLVANRRLPRFRPGQFIQLTVDHYDPSGFWPESRPFSVANAVTDRKTVKLTVSRQGTYTSRIIDGVAKGDVLWAKGPYGTFTIRDDSRFDQVVMVAGGTGFTPFAAYLDAALGGAVAPRSRVILFYGARIPELLVYEPLVKRCSSTFDWLDAHLFVEHLSSTAGGHLRVGRLPFGEIASCEGDGDTAFYISGPKQMIDDFQEGLVGNGVPPTHVFVDEWE